MNKAQRYFLISVYLVGSLYTFGHAASNYEETGTLGPKMAVTMGWMVWPAYWSYQIQRNGE